MPLKMDILIIKKEKYVKIKNQIGKIFKKHVDDILLNELTITLIREALRELMAKEIQEEMQKATAEESGISIEEFLGKVKNYEKSE